MEEEISLDLSDFIHMLRKRIKLVLLITILSTAVSGALSYYIIKPTYEAKATIVVGKNGIGLNNESKYQFDDIMMYQKLIKTYAEIAKSTAVAENTSARLKNVSAKDISHDITITPMADTQVIEFKAQSSSPQGSYLLLNAFYNSFMQEAKRIFPDPNIQVIDEAKIPVEPIKPKKLLNIVVAFFIGLMASVGLTLLLEYMDDTLKTEQDINKYLGLPVIGIIPKDIRKY